jgi:Ribbon-helix-helix protein, copG family.
VRVVTFKLDEDLIRLITTLAIKYRISRSELIRRAILSYIKQLESDGYVHIRRYKID